MFALIFLLTTGTATAAPTCTKTTALTAESGSFTDGSAVKSPYADGQDLCWKVAPSCPEDGSLSLHFTRADIEVGYDWVQVFDVDGKLLTKSAGTSTSFHSTALLVWFHSDESDARTGFNASYSCDTLSEEEAPVEELDE